MVKGQGHWEQKCEHVDIFVKSGSIYVKPRPNWSAKHSIHIEYMSQAEMLRFRCNL